MQNKYKEYKLKVQKIYGKFPKFYALDDEQFFEGMESLGLGRDKEEKIVAVGGGAYILKEDMQKFKEMFNNFDKELDNLIKEDTKGKGFIKDMFEYELNNHEYSYTRDISDTLISLGLTIDDIIENKALANGLKLAINEILSDENGSEY